MRKVLIGLLGLVLVFVGCTKRWKWEIIRYRAPNWTSDGRIVFMRDHYIQKWEQDPVWSFGGTRQVGGHQEIFVCEIDVGGSNFREVCKIVDEEFERGPNQIPISTSSAGEYVVISKEDWTKGEHYTEMFIMKRDGTRLKNLGEGSWPDLSPDGKRLVYQKPNQGIWIKNIDGSGDRQIVGHTKATQPSWSSSGATMGYVRFDTVGLFFIDTLGTPMLIWNGDTIVSPVETGGIDFGPADSNAIIVDGARKNNSYFEHGFIILKINPPYNYRFTLCNATRYRWSPNGNYIVAQDSIGSFVMKVDGTNKWYLKP